MKILIVQDRLRSGGTERQSLLLAHGFQAAGHPTRLLTFRPGGTLAPSAADLDHHALQSRDWGLDWWAPGLVRAARAFAPDIVLTMGRMANSRGAQLQAALSSTAVIATMRTGKPLPAAFRRSLAHVTHIVANSEGAAGRLRRENAVPPERISVIHNSLVFPPDHTPTDSDRISRIATTADLRAQQGATPDTTVLLCVAMFRPEKNQRALIPIVAALPRDTRWQLWFGGTGATVDDCVALAAKNGLTERVKFLGFHTDPTPLYRAADIAVLTSTRESLSNFLIESQAHGLPAVAYDAQGVGEAFLPGESGHLIPMDDEAAFTAALAHLISNPAARQRLGQAASDYARTHFAPAGQIQAYLDLFQRLRQPPRP